MVSSPFIRASFGLAALGSIPALTACSDPDRAFAPSGNAITAPDTSQSFDAYVASTRERLRSVLETQRFAAESDPFNSFTLDQVVDMRAPYLVSPDPVACANTEADDDTGSNLGFLLVHGLTDGPYWLSSIRDDLHDRYPCATIHGVLLPGHGTVPGDLIDISHEDWLETVRYGIDAFDDSITQIIPVGFSTGAALIGRDFVNRADNHRIKGMVMLSPGLAARSGQAWLTPYVRYVRDWVGQGTHNDPGKYGSMAMNAAAEFHILTEPYREGTIETIDIPVFIAISSDDRTVNARSAVDFFCQKVSASNKHLIWYQGAADPLDPATTCDGIDVVASANEAFRTLNHAHTAITMHPDDPVYGLDGAVADCGHYDGPDQDSCKSSENAVYGERNLIETVGAGGMRRGTFNPDFSGMMDKMSVFIENAVGQTN